MIIFTDVQEIPTSGQGLYEITDVLVDAISRHHLQRGTATVFCQHTSCSLVIMENADPTARADLEKWMHRLVPEQDPHFRHTLEGPDDMPAHIKMALTRTSETIPVANGRLMLGTWQGVYLWEHRRAHHTRRIVFSGMGE